MHELLSPTAKQLRAVSNEAMVRNGAVALLGFALYGFTVGFWRSPLMGVFVAVKMPLLIVFTLGCNGLLNGLIGILLGSGLNFRQSLHALLGAFAISGAILGSVAPVTFFLAVNIPSADSVAAVTSHSSYLLVHVFLIGLAGLAGVVKLGGLLEDFAPTRFVARMTLGAWIVGNAFLGAQFSWILRPFFGSPGLEAAFLREDPMRGSFYEAVWRALGRLMPDFSMNFIIMAGGVAVFTGFVFIERTYRERKQTS